MNEDRAPERVENDYGGSGEPNMPVSSSGGLKALIPTLLISAVVCVGILVSGVAPSAYVTKNDLTTNMNALGTDLENTKKTISAAQTQAAQATQDVASVRSAISGYAKQTDLTALSQKVDKIPTQTDTSALTSQISSLQSKIDSLSSQVSTDKATITNLQTQLAAIQNGTSTNGGTPVTGAVKAELVTNSNIVNWFTTVNSTASQAYSIPFKVKITNGLNKDIQNLQVYTQVMGFATSGVFPTGTASMTSSTGGVWNIYATSGNSWYFTNSNTVSWAGSGMSVPANSTKTITLIFTYTVQPNQTPATIQFNQDIAPVSVGDYDIP